MDKATLSLVKMAKENPWHFFAFAEIALIFGFGTNTLTAIVSAGAPVVARKINPAHLSVWLCENAEKVGKIRKE